MRVSRNGRHIASVKVRDGEQINELDPLATCMAAAMRRGPGESALGKDGITPQDLRRRLRVQPVKKTILFLVDSSDSMLVEEQMKLAKGAVLGLLTQAYQKRYRVGVVAFHDWEAKVILPPTTSIARARHELQAVVTGGGTPLAHGLQTVLQTVHTERIRHPNDMQQMILITDGRPSVSLKPSANIRDEVLSLSEQFPARNIPAIVLATAEPGALLKEIALRMKAPLRKLRDVIHA